MIKKGKVAAKEIQINFFFFHSEGGEAVEQAAQRARRVSVFGDTGKSAGESPELPSVS